MLKSFFTIITMISILSGCQMTQLPDIKQSPASFNDLQNFEKIDLKASSEAFYLSCKHFLKSSSLSHKVIQGPNWKKVCQKFILLHPMENKAFRQFLRNEFDVIKQETHTKKQGLLTGYFQPEVEASLQKTDIYKYPIYKRPPELIVIEDLSRFNKKAKGIRIAGIVKDGSLSPYFTRQEINKGALENKGHEIAWAKDPIDLFFMHIQGSGRLKLKKESIPILFQNVSYDGTNGMLYTAIGKTLIEQGDIQSQNMSMDAIKQWLKNHPNKAQSLMEINESYVFFRVLDKTHNSPIGAQQTSLTPMATIAVDPHYIPLGSLVWIDTDHSFVSQKLTVAQDVGGAIKGPLRGDFYCGTGNTAGKIAGSLKASASFYILIPKEKS